MHIRKFPISASLALFVSLLMLLFVLLTNRDFFDFVSVAVFLTLSLMGIRSQVIIRNGHVVIIPICLPSKIFPLKEINDVYATDVFHVQVVLKSHEKIIINCERFQGRKIVSMLKNETLGIR